MIDCSVQVTPQRTVRLVDAGAFDRLRGELDAAARQRPCIVTLTTERHTIELGLAGERAFVQVVAASGEPPYEVTVGDAGDRGRMGFALHGEHHTEIPCRHLVSSDAAWRAVRALVVDGRRDDGLVWETL